MAKCKICDVEIPDGSKYCKDCREKKLESANESYLDGLLSSVKDTSQTADNIYKKKNNSGLNGAKAEDKLIIAEDDMSGSDEEYNINDEANAMLQSELEDQDTFKVDLSDIEDFDQFNLEDDLGGLDTDIMIKDEELFGADNSTDADINDAMEHNLIEDEITEYPADDKTDEELDNLLSDIDSIDLNSYSLREPQAADTLQASDEEKAREDKGTVPESDDRNAGQVEFEGAAEEDNDILNLLGQMSSDDPVTEDIMAINNLLKGMTTGNNLDADMPSDVGEVFSDALTAVTALKDYEVEDDDILTGNTDFEEEAVSAPSKKAVKPAENDIKASKSEKKKEKPAKKDAEISFFQRLFGNVKDGKTAAQHEAEVKAAKEPADAAKKFKKKNKGAKGASFADGAADSDQDTENGSKQQTAKERREARRKEKAEKKKNAREAKKAIQVIDEEDADPGRINRLGAVLVFVFFGIVASVLILGTDVVSYSLSIKHAQAYFDKQKYNEAYDEISGEVIKDQDSELYNKILTVMYVNKQLNSYHSYYAIQDYPNALDSLLKGLKRYDKYIELATILGIEEDMDYVRVQILAELKHVFNLSEKDALKIIEAKDSQSYSIDVYNVILENMTE